MIFIERPKIEDALDEPARNHLHSRATEAAELKPKSKTTKPDDVETQPQKPKNPITSRWASFQQGKGSDDPHGPRVCNAVRAFCRNKCAYCESSSAPTIEHIWPKSEYPAKMFDWDNFLAACRDCNSEKLAEFKLDENHKALMIDPTLDEPLEHFRWDAITGKCKHEETNVRAVETARRIKMDRSLGERIAKLKRMRYFFAQCIREKPISDELRKLLREEFESSRSHLCIVRSYLLYPDKPEDRILISGAIRELPEILDWVKPWLHPPRGVTWPP